MNTLSSSPVEAVVDAIVAGDQEAATQAYHNFSETVDTTAIQERGNRASAVLYMAVTGAPNRPQTLAEMQAFVEQV